MVAGGVPPSRKRQRVNWKTGLLIVALLFGCALLLPGIREHWWVIHPSRTECYEAKMGPVETENRLEKEGVDVKQNWGGRYDYDLDPWKNGRRRDIIYMMLGKTEKASFYKKNDECEADKMKGYISWNLGL